MDLYLTARFDKQGSILHYAVQSEGSTISIRGNVTVHSEIEASLSAAYLAIKKTLEKSESYSLNFHTDLKYVVEYSSGKYKPMNDVCKKYVKGLKAFEDKYDCSIFFDNEITPQQSKELYQRAFGNLVKEKEEIVKPLVEGGKEKIEKPFESPKREIKSRAWQNWHSAAPTETKSSQSQGTKDKGEWGVRVCDQNNNLICDWNNKDLGNDLPFAVWYADFSEQIEGKKVERRDIPAHFFIFGDAEGDTYTTVYWDKNKMVHWKLGKPVSSGTIVEDIPIYDSNVKKEFDMKIANYKKKLGVDTLSAPLQEQEKTEEEIPKKEYEQLGLF